MKAKNLFAIFTIAFAMLFIVGCGNSPKDALENWREAILEGDMKQAKKHCTLTKSELEKLESRMSDHSFYRHKFKADTKMALEEEEGVFIKDDYALISVKPDVEFFFEKVDGKWKVCSKSCSLNFLIR